MFNKIKEQLEEKLKGLAPKLKELKSKIPLSFLKKKSDEEANAEEATASEVETTSDVAEASTEASPESSESVSEERPASAEGHEAEDKTGHVSEGEISEAKAKAEESEASTNSEDEAKKLKKKKMIRVAAGVVIALLVADTLFNSSEETAQVQTSQEAILEKKLADAKKRKAERLAKKKAEEAKLAEAANATPGQVAQTDATTEVAAQPEAVVQTTTTSTETAATPPATENQVVAQQTTTAEIPTATSNTTPNQATAAVEPSKTEAPVVSSAQDNPAVATASTTSETNNSAPAIATSENSVSSEADATNNAATGSAAPEAQLGTVPPVDQTLTVASVTPPETSPTQNIEKLPSDLNLGEVKNSAESASVDTQKSLDTEEVVKDYAAPEYNQVGRGLVYNCKGKHWACVNRENYFKCRDNAKWSTANSKPKECTPVDVYASDSDCKTVQINNINTRKDTGFCK